MSYLTFRRSARIVRGAIVAASSVAAVLFPATSAFPDRFPKPVLVATEAEGPRVDHPWARASAGNATTGAAYLAITGGAQPDRLLGGSTPIANAAEVHETTNANGVMQMRPISEVLVPAGQTVTLAPGGYHVMLMGLKKPLVAGQTFPLTLRFARTQPITVDVQVEAVGRGSAAAMPAPAH